MNSVEPGFTAAVLHADDAFGPLEHTKAGYDHRDRAAQIIGKIFGTNGILPDVAFFPEAYAVGCDPDDILKSIEDIQNNGYAINASPYIDNDTRRDRHGMLMAVAEDSIVDGPTSTYLEGRSMQYAIIGLQGSKVSVKAAGIHLDDRSERRRTNDIIALNRNIGPDEPVVVMGTTNGTYRDAPWARTFRILGNAARLIPHEHPGKPRPRGPFEQVTRIASLLSRNGEMASGLTLHALRAIGLEDADPDRLPTTAYPDSHVYRPIIQLDRIMHSYHLEVTKFTSDYDPTISNHALLMARFVLASVF